MTVVSVAGRTCNTINLLQKNNLSVSVNLLAVNTVLAVLLHINAASTILDGED